MLVAAAGFDFDAAAAAVVGLTVFLVADWRSVDQGPHCGFHRFLVFGCCPLHCYAHPLTGLVAEAVGCLHSAGPEDSAAKEIPSTAAIATRKQCIPQTKHQ